MIEGQIPDMDPVYLRTRTNGIHKIVTDLEVLYVLHGRGSDRFESRAYASAEEVADEAMRIEWGGTHEDWCDDARNTRIIHNLRRSNIHDAIRLCSELKLVKPLTKDEASTVQGFYRFLYALVHHHPDYSELIREYMTKTIEHLGYGSEDVDDVVSNATDAVFGDQFLLSISTRPSHEISTTQQRKCAGRYVSKLAELACIAGPGKLAMHEMIDRFRNHPKTMAETLAQFNIKL